VLEFGFILHQGCSGGGTRENGIPTPLFLALSLDSDNFLPSKAFRLDMASLAIS